MESVFIALRGDNYRALIITRAGFTTNGSTKGSKDPMDRGSQLTRRNDSFENSDRRQKPTFCQSYLVTS